MTGIIGRIYCVMLTVFVGVFFVGCTDEGLTGGKTFPDGYCEIETDCVPQETCKNNLCVPRSTGDVGVGEDTTPGENNGGGEECTVPVSCAASGVECGHIPDGCGGVKACGSCGEGEFCNNGVCSGATCVRSGSCAGIECGTVPDGCGDTIECGSCSPGKTCGNGATRGQCLSPGACTPKTNCAANGITCGPMADGCGGFVQCGGCAQGNKCDAGTCKPVQCTPKVKADFPGTQCGFMPDGCGGQVDFGNNCPVGQICGGGGERGKCGAPSCTPKTKADFAGIKDCGAISDGCSGTIDLGECMKHGEICGGDGIANKCGNKNFDPNCTNLCLKQEACSGGAATTLTGTTFAPNGKLRVPNAAVYVPNVPLHLLPKIKEGSSCERCADEDFGSPVVSTISDELGNFTLRHVPVGVEFPLVIKVGKWRRVVMIPPQAACGTRQLTAEQTRLPKRHNENSIHDHIPKTAFATGYVDAMECVLKKIGVEQDQFTGNDQSGRIHLYRANGGTPNAAVASACTGAGCNIRACSDLPVRSTGANPNTACTGSAAQNTLLNTHFATNLYNSAAKLKSYDMVVFDCEGINAYSDRTGAHRQNVLDYVNGGGRVFASHLSYSWLYQTSPLSTTASWYGSWQNENHSLATVDTTHLRGMAFWNWLVKENANHPTGNRQISIAQPRYFVTANDTNKSTRWVHTESGKAGHVGGNSVQQYSFDTPVGSANACGRVVYSAFHVDEVDTRKGEAFPTYCVGTELTPQEKVLAFMLFDLGACITPGGGPPQPPTCNPQTCAQLGAVCGSVGDGCGGVLQCGSCPSGSLCGGSGVPNQCGGSCKKLTCAEQGAQCGETIDGCGGTLNCGPCPNGQSCGADGVLNTCSCVPLTCESHGAQCGTVSNGCGGTLNCGECGPGQFCGIGAEANICITPGGCQPLSCADHGANCGTVSDGCGGSIACGSCEAPETCGGGGKRNQCGSTCKPLTCADHGASCGQVSDGCGGTLTCGTCAELDVCDRDTMQCVTPACLGTGGSCFDDRQCCGGVCAPGRDGAGVCAAN